MGKKSRRRPDRKKKDVPAPATAAPAPAPAAAPAAITGAAAAPMPAGQAMQTLEEWFNSIPQDVRDDAMKVATLKSAKDNGVKTFVSPTLKCHDCKTNRFEPPAMLCAFCPKCPVAQCGPCSIEHGPYNHTVCPKCKITVCHDHAFTWMEDNGTGELCFGMTCFGCETTRRAAEETWKRFNEWSSPSEAAPVSAPAPAPAPAPEAGRRRRRRVCDICGERGKFVCDACGARRYCSETCQAADWEVHQTKCLMFLQMNTIGGALEEIESTP